jgi:hypothetical protein
MGPLPEGRPCFLGLIGEDLGVGQARVVIDGVVEVVVSGPAVGRGPDLVQASGGPAELPVSAAVRDPAE